MNKIKAYISHSIMGKGGANATDKEMEDNCNRALRFGAYIRDEFPTIGFYVPAEHEGFVSRTYKKKWLTISQILDIDCEIVGECNFLIVFAPDHYISKGMQTEVDYAQLHSIPVLYVNATNLNYMHKKIINNYLAHLMR